MTEREKVFARLEELGVSYEVTEHPAVFTIGEMDALGLTAKGEVCKNLFLRDAKGRRHFLVVVPGEARADLRALAAQLESSKLSFASAERLEKYLGLKQGEVTPLGVLNDADAAVEVVFDRGLERFPCLGVHPNDNTATVWLSLADILRVVEGNGNEIRWVTL
ncbi:MULTISPECIES: prolyl-tRNA synthetase associated domain-containing protein [Anaerotruncus]|uniref:prolyl-tRNA synthetase associated domain-containing protein n=1 Tax=Anaerotruncus TaxID=244127 RepID=UPI000C78A7ED|nr:prolyl-tRNA synthetase associated domain-containing protein [Anaerotruncus massiliensis (ex Togo et al. 2019)]GKH45892.1 prolyl-tRNA editing protein proX [Oscillospiraceae bacterium]